jgi:hypothetical protein
MAQALRNKVLQRKPELENRVAPAKPDHAGDRRVRDPESQAPGRAAKRHMAGQRSQSSFPISRVDFVYDRLQRSECQQEIPQSRRLEQNNCRSLRPRDATDLEKRTITVDVSNLAEDGTWEAYRDRRNQIIDAGGLAVCGGMVDLTKNLGRLHLLRKATTEAETELKTYFDKVTEYEAAGRPAGKEPRLPTGYEVVFLEATDGSGVGAGDRSKLRVMLPRTSDGGMLLEAICSKLIGPDAHLENPQLLGQLPSKNFRVQVLHGDLSPIDGSGRLVKDRLKCYSGLSNPQHPLCLLWPQKRTRFWGYLGSHKLSGFLFEVASDRYDEEEAAWKAENSGKTAADFANVWIAKMEQHLQDTFPDRPALEAVTFTLDGPDEAALFSGLHLHGGTMDEGLRFFFESAEKKVHCCVLCKLCLAPFTEIDFLLPCRALSFQETTRALWRCPCTSRRFSRRL